MLEDDDPLMQPIEMSELTDDILRDKRKSKKWSSNAKRCLWSLST